MLDDFTTALLVTLTGLLRSRLALVSRSMPICRESTLFVEATVVLNAQLGEGEEYDEWTHAWLLDAARAHRDSPESLADLMAMAVDTVAAEYGFARK